MSANARMHRELLSQWASPAKMRRPNLFLIGTSDSTSLRSTPQSSHRASRSNNNAAVLMLSARVLFDISHYIQDMPSVSPAAAKPE